MIIFEEGLTFFFTDIEKSTQHWERDPHAMAVALARHDEVIRNAIEARGGRVFKTGGDAFNAVFSDPLQAALAAIRAQREIQGVPNTSVGPLAVRIALHTGQAQERDGDFFGPPLNRIARLLSAMHGGQILLSEISEQLVRTRLPPEATLHDLGEHRLRDLTRPQRVFQLTAPGLSLNFPPLQTLEARPNNLPAQPNALIGREGSVSEIRKQMQSDEVRLLTLTGPGGTGKTRLSLQVAADSIDEFRHGVYFVGLSSISDPHRVIPAIAQSLDIREVEEQSPKESVKGYLRDRQLLLLLDNFEQVVEAAPLISDLLASSPKLKVLVTSRTALKVSWERVYPVSPLSTPDERRVPSPDELLRYEAIRLFFERARAVSPRFEITAENASAVAEICRRLDGLPLAIELAAARIRLLTPQAILSRLESRLKLLIDGAKDLPVRQQTLRGAIDWSYDALDEGDRRLFRRLSAFVRGCSLDAAEVVCDSDGDLRIDVLDGLQSLVDKSLIRQEDEGDDLPRFGMLETIREYALDQLKESGEELEVRRRHARFYQCCVEGARPQLTGSDDSARARRLDWMELEYDNLHAALEFFLNREDPLSGLQMATGMWWFWQVRGHWTEGWHWLERALLANPAAPAFDRARALDGAMTLVRSMGDLLLARRLGEEALSLFRNLNDPYGTAEALTHLAPAVYNSGRQEQGKAMYEEALALYRKLNEKSGMARSLDWLGMVALYDGNYEEATRCLEESLELFREIGDQRGIGNLLCSLGELEYEKGDFDQGDRLLEESLTLRRLRNDKLAIGYTLMVMGRGARERGDLDRAAAYYEESLRFYRDLGGKRSLAHLYKELGDIAYQKGNLSRAAELWEERLAICRELGDKRRVAGSLQTLGNIYQRLGDYHRALPYLEESRSAYQSLISSQSPSDQLGVTSHLGEVVEPPSGAEKQRDTDVHPES